MSNNTTLSDFFDDPELIETQLGEDDLFAIFESLDSVADFPPVTPLNDNNTITDHPTAETNQLAIETSISPKGNKRQKITRSSSSTTLDVDNNTENGQQRMSHITVERNRRKQMNEHLSVLRSLMPCFYVKRGDQASIIGGVVNYINELQQVLQSLEAKKQRKVVYNEVLSPRLTPSSSISSPRPSPQVLSPRKPPLSPRLNLPISPKTPQPPAISPYRPPPPAPTTKLLQQQQSYTLSPSSSTSSPSPSNSANTSMNFESNNVVNELVANSKSAVADVEVKFCGPNLILKTVSPKIPGQTAKIISTLEELSLEILQVNISSIEDTLFNSFTIKIGIECQLSAEELAQQIQQTFC